MDRTTLRSVRVECTSNEGRIIDGFLEMLAQECNKHFEPAFFTLS